MNDPRKRLDVNISSLLSLKAELLRKQQEASRDKAKHSIENFVPRRNAKIDVKPSITPSAVPSANESDKQQSTEYEDTEMLKKSKRMLERKSKYYDRMTKSGGGMNSDENCLVMFNQKKQTEKDPNHRYASSSSNDDSSADESNRSPYDYESATRDDDWVEYVDCLGRTRKCLQKDLEFFKKKDLSLAGTLHERIEAQEKPKWIVDTAGEPQPTHEIDSVEEVPAPVMADDSQLANLKQQQMKMQWEEQEKENVDKDYVHYQNVLFDEARTHGVGYYQFSTDDTERLDQQKELEAMRQRTLDAQKQREEQRAARDTILQNRVRAAKNRTRARLGLPPEEDEKPKEDELLYNKTEEDRRNAEAEQKQRVKEAEEQILNAERKRHVRPWDKGKSSSGGDPHPRRLSHDSDSSLSSSSSLDNDKEWQPKREREPMSQQEWNAKKRDERVAEFGPIGPFPSQMVDEPATLLSSIASPPLSPSLPPPPGTEFDSADQLLADTNRSLYFTSKKQSTAATPKWRSYQNTVAPTPIVNELIENDAPAPASADVAVKRHAEIPPPPTFDYYGPSSSSSASKHRRPNLPVKRNELEMSIEAGLRFLREQSDKGKVGTKGQWSAKADY